MAMMGFNLKKKGIIPGCAIDEEGLYEGGGADWGRGRRGRRRRACGGRGRGG